MPHCPGPDGQVPGILIPAWIDIHDCTGPIAFTVSVKEALSRCIMFSMCMYTAYTPRDLLAGMSERS
jgi:hypothetical protein